MIKGHELHTHICICAVRAVACFFFFTAQQAWLTSSVRLLSDTIFQLGPTSLLSPFPLAAQAVISIRIYMLYASLPPKSARVLKDFPVLAERDCRRVPLIFDGPESCGQAQKLCDRSVRVCAFSRQACLNSLSEPFRNCWSGCHVQCKWGSMNSVWQEGVCMYVCVCLWNSVG